MKRQPTGRLGTPQEVANVALFLASDEVSLLYLLFFQTLIYWSHVTCAYITRTQSHRAAFAENIV